MGVRARVATAAAATVVVVAALVVALVATWSTVDALRALAQARQLSAAEQSAVAETVAASGDLSAAVSQRTADYRAAAERWRSYEASAEQWRADDADPTLQRANPGGALPGDGGAERALLAAIGAGDVQLMLDAGPQNCGYTSAILTGLRASGGCYRPAYRDWLFLAWDAGVADDDVWPVFVHEAMHWFQWNRYATLIEAVRASSVDDATYGEVIETDASCRAVVVHGVSRSSYDRSSAPCDVDGWTEGWFAERLAALGVEVAAPDPEAFEAQPVLRAATVTGDGVFARLTGALERADPAVVRTVEDVPAEPRTCAREGWSQHPLVARGTLSVRAADGAAAGVLDAVAAELSGDGWSPAPPSTPGGAVPDGMRAWSSRDGVTVVLAEAASVVVIAVFPPCGA